MGQKTVSGATVLGTLELKGKALTLSVNSASRVEWGKALILEMLGDFLKPPLNSIRTLDRAMSEREMAPESSRGRSRTSISTGTIATRWISRSRRSAP